MLEDNLDPPASSSAGITMLYATSLLYMTLGTEPSMNFWYARPTLPNVLHLRKQCFCSFSVVIAYRVKYTLIRDNLDSPNGAVGKSDCYKA